MDSVELQHHNSTLDIIVVIGWQAASTFYRLDAGRSTSVKELLLKLQKC